MFITILEVLMDQTETKIIKHKCYLAFMKTNNLSDFQRSERLIARTAKELSQALLQLGKQIK